MTWNRLTVQLDPETEAHLADILADEKTDRSELIRRLINERWLSLQAGHTLVERMVGHPKRLLEGADPNLSERPNRNKALATLDRDFDIYRRYHQQHE